MSDTTVLKRMFQDEILLRLESHHNNKKKVILRELQALDSLVEIHNIPSDSIIIDLDRAFNNSMLFKGDQGECKRADFIVISEEKQKVIFIELKRSNLPSKKDIVNQLKGSFCAFEYCKVIAAEFFQERDFLKHYQLRFVNFRQTNIPKKRTIIKREESLHDSPENPLYINKAQVIQYNKIA